MLNSAAAIRSIVAELTSMAKGLKGRFILVAEQPEQAFSRHVQHVPGGHNAYDQLLKAVADFQREYPPAKGWHVRVVPQVVRARDEHMPANIRDGFGRNQVPREKRKDFCVLASRLTAAIAGGA